MKFPSWNAPSLRRRLKRLGRWLAWLVLGLVLLSVALVLPYRFVPPPASALMAQRSLAALLDGQDGRFRYQWVALEDIAPAMALAAVAGEDQKFPQHMGFDLDSIRQALARRAEGGRLRGASTISQQVAKNLYLWPGRSFLRKGIEAWFTLLIETLWPKRRILEVYLNIVELGTMTFGVEAASRRFFGVPATRLSPAQAALLAAVLPNPHIYRVEAPSGHVRQRQDWIRRQMRNLGSGYLDSL